MTLLCPQCFGDRGLQRRIEGIRRTFPAAKCSFHPSRKGVPIEDVAKIIDEVFRQNYQIADPGYDGEGGDSLETTICELTGADDDGVVRAVIGQLIDADDYWPPDGDEPFYQEDFGYEQSLFALTAHSNLWTEFCHDLLHGQRFFNLKAIDHLREIFDGIHLQRTRDGLWPVYVIQPDDPQSRFFRARIADDIALRKKIMENVATELGPPPGRLRRAGRMNPAGISAFYGAFDLDTCIAELRPPVGSIVMGAQFAITKPLWVLDTTRFQAPPRELGIFARDHIRRAGQWHFMARFMLEISRPISPADEHLDYIPTQAVAEYLLRHHEFMISEKKAKIEAIIYRSAQNPGGKNIAILGAAAEVGILEEDKLEAGSNGGSQKVKEEPWLSILGRPEPFRVAAKPTTVEIRYVEGATYAAKPYRDFQGDPDAEDF